MSSRKSYRSESRADWCWTDGRSATQEDMRTGAILRIADAIEKAATQLDNIDRRLIWIERRLSRAAILNQRKRKPAKKGAKK